MLPRTYSIHICQTCNGPMRVKDTRATKLGNLIVRRRRRFCELCNKQVTTFEVPLAFIHKLMKENLLYRDLTDAMTDLTDT